VNSFFFCQAEDGIRDFHVTGVQTCALPIFGTRAESADQRSHMPSHSLARRSSWPRSASSKSVPYRRHRDRVGGFCMVRVRQGGKIGRASCRERVEIWEDGEDKKNEMGRQVV